MDKNVVITGASRGIGRAAAIRFLEDGDRVITAARSNSQALEELAAAYPGRVFPILADLSDRAEVEHLAAFCLSTFSRIDVLVNNAGIARQQLFVDMSDPEWDEMWQVNVSAPVLLTRALLPGMLARRSGCIVNVSSIWGVSGASCEVAYSASKAAILNFSRSLAKEVGLMGIRVNAVVPGVIDTDMCSKLSEETRRELAEQTALGRLGTPEDVAGAIWLLTRPEAAYITGAVLSVDGGFSGN